MQLTPIQEDALKEIVNIGVGRAAGSLSELIGMRIELFVPDIQLTEVADGPGQARQGADRINVVVAQDFLGSFSGRAALMFPQASGIKLARLLSGVEGPADELDLELSGILTEVGNIMLNGVLGSLANVLATHLEYTVPRFYSDRMDMVLQGLKPEGAAHPLLLVADVHFQVSNCDITGSLLLVFELGSVEAVLHSLCGSLAAV